MNHNIFTWNDDKDCFEHDPVTSAEDRYCIYRQTQGGQLEYTGFIVYGKDAAIKECQRLHCKIGGRYFPVLSNDS